MIILRDDLTPFDGETVLTIGKFDGLHLGHQEVIRLLRERAAALGVQTGLITFDPHPSAVLNPQGPPPLLTPVAEKSRLAEALGLDVLVYLTFNRALMETRATPFLDRLAESLRPREIWVGSDFALGYKREGNIAFIRAWGEPRGIAVHDIPLVVMEGAPVTASRIRALLDAGEVGAAARLLGRNPGMTGIVQHGDHRGRQLGFPTANLIPEPTLALPVNGVYASRATLVDGSRHRSVTNVGTRPTFDGQRRQVETHLLDWDGDLYDKPLTVEFLHRLRGEQKFASLEALVAQIGADVARARDMLQAER